MNLYITVCEPLPKICHIRFQCVIIFVCCLLQFCFVWALFHVTHQTDSKFDVFLFQQLLVSVVKLLTCLALFRCEVSSLCILSCEHGSVVLSMHQACVMFAVILTCTFRAEYFSRFAYFCEEFAAKFHAFSRTVTRCPQFIGCIFWSLLTVYLKHIFRVHYWFVWLSDYFYCSPLLSYAVWKLLFFIRWGCHPIVIINEDHSWGQ